MKKPVSHLLVATLFAALIIGALGAAVSAATSYGMETTSTGSNQAGSADTTTGTATPTATTTATTTTTSGQGSSGASGEGAVTGHQFVPYESAAYAVPGRIEAENYDRGLCQQGTGQGGSTTGTVTATPTATSTSGQGGAGTGTTATTTATTSPTTTGQGAGNATATPTATATSGNGTSGQGTGNATSGMNITILAPNATEMLPGPNATMMVDVRNFDLVDPMTVNDTPAAGQGHIHYFLDVVPPTEPGVPARTGIAGTLFETPNTTVLWANLTPGWHTLYVMLVNNDHTPVFPIVNDSVSFQVSDWITANGTSGQGTSGMGTTATVTATGTGTGTATGTTGTIPGNASIGGSSTGFVSLVTGTGTATAGNGTSGQGAGNVTGEMSIALLAPNGTAPISGRMVTVMAQVTNFSLVDPDMVNLTPAPGQGHIHYFLDAVPVTTPGMPAETGIANTVFETPNTTIQWANVTPGMHTMYAMLVNNDHTPVIPIVVDSVTFQVSNATNATGASGQSGTGTGSSGISTGTGTSGTGLTGTGTYGIAAALVMALLDPDSGSSSEETAMTTSPTVTPTGEGSSGQGSSGNQTIVQIAQADSNFSTLVTALQTAGLVETLNGTGPFTVFAPTNAAFDALPSGTLDALLANTTALTDILTYHVVSGNYPAAQVVTMSSLTTVQGQPLNVTVQAGGGVRVDGANIIRTDIQASNGVIHVIDAVMVPPNATSGEGGSGTGTITPTATTTGTTTATTTSGQGGSGTGSAGQANGEYTCAQGWAYFDRTPGNDGGQYRQDDVDIENGGSGHVVAFVKSSEWLIYSVNVAEAGTYRATFRASSPWDDREIWVWVDGILEGQVKVPNTGSFDTYQDATAEIRLPSGDHYIRLQFVRDSQNLDYMTFERTGDLTTGEGSSGSGSGGAQVTTTATTTATSTTTTTTSGEGSSGQDSGTTTPTITSTSTQDDSDQDTDTTATTTVTATSTQGSSGEETGTTPTTPGETTTMTACPTETTSGSST